MANHILSPKEASDMLLAEYHRNVFPIWQEYCKNGKFLSSRYTEFQQEIQPHWAQFMKAQLKLHILPKEKKEGDNGNPD